MSNSRYKNEYTAAPIPDGPQLEYISYSKFEDDWNSQLHYHPFMEIALVVGGEGSLLLENSKYPVSTGHLILIPQNRLHTEVSSSHNPLEYYILGVRNFSIHEELIQDSSTEANPALPLGELMSLIEPIFTEMFHEMKLHRAGHEMMIQSLLLRLAVLLTRRTDLKASFDSTEEMRRGCAIVKDYIDSHYADKITLDDLARISCISKFHLIHEFSRYVGKPPIAYQLKRKIQESKYLLESTDSSIADISYTLGFSSISHFSQRFKLEEGCSPLKYRKRVSQGRQNLKRR